MVVAQRQFVMIPLGKTDNFNDSLSITAAYIVHCPGHLFDHTILERAVTRAIDKHRLIAGRLQSTKHNNRWRIKVPIGPLPLDYRTFTCAVTQIPTVHTPPFHHSPSSAASVRPHDQPVSYYRNKSFTPVCNAAYASKQLPFLTIQITKFTDSVCIGLNFPHGVMDGHGFALLTYGISCELSGEEWTPPKLQPINRLDALLQPLPGDAPHLEEPAYAHPLRDHTPRTTSSLCSFLSNVALEQWWHGATRKCIFLGRDILKPIIASAKAEVKALGSGDFVSTNDILLAWFFKTLYSGEPLNDDLISWSAVFSSRPVLTPLSDPLALTTYAHNAMSTAPLPILSGSQIRTNSLGATALLYRHGLVAAKTKQFILESLAPLESGTFPVPLRRAGREVWGVSNQSHPWIQDINFRACVTAPPADAPVEVMIDEYMDENGPPQYGRTKAWWTETYPFEIDRFVSIIELMDHEGQNGNFSIECIMRPNRWKIFEEEIAKLQLP